MLLRATLLVSERLQLMHQTLGVDPTQRVLTDIELPGVVADHDRFAQEPVCAHRAPQRALGGDAHRVGRHLQTGQAELLKMVQPRFLIDKLPLLMRDKSLDERSGQRMIAHVPEPRR
jgi:hypothetical protein